MILLFDLYDTLLDDLALLLLFILRRNMRGPGSDTRKCFSSMSNSLHVAAVKADAGYLGVLLIAASAMARKDGKLVEKNW